jgi:hypothetical protein
MDSPQWDSSFAKYLLAAGVVLFVVGLNPFNTRTGDELWLTDLVKIGPEIIAQFTAAQVFLMLAGISLLGYGIYHERSIG